VDKVQVITQIKEYLAQELKELETPAGSAINRVRPEAPQLDEEAEQRMKDLKSLLLMYRFLPVRNYNAEDVIVPSALVQLQLGSAVAYYFIAPQGGGLITNVDGKAVQVITPNSPLGDALLGKKAGDKVQVEIRGGIREYQILSVL
jgi:hypothetical protein